MLLPIGTSREPECAPITQLTSYDTRMVGNSTNYITSHQPINSILRQPY